MALLRDLWPVALATLVQVASCSSSPPPHISDQAEAAVYADAIAEARRTLQLGDTVAVHPYLAVATDTTGTPTLDIRDFEYEPSVPLKLLDEQERAVRLCRVDERGMCEGQYLILSRFTRVGERDAVIVVQSVRGPGSGRHLILNLRYRGEAWTIAYAREA